MKKVFWFLIIVLVVFILTFAVFYFTKFNNIFASKKNLEKPSISIDFIKNNPGIQVIKEEHIDYLTNELGAYKLHSYNDEAAVMVFEITDINKKLALIVDDSKSSVKEDIPEKYDMLISGDQLVIAELIESTNLSEDIVAMGDDGNITVELVSDMTTLAMKGYLAVYSEITG